MGKQCPKCDYQREDADAAPAGECPACGIVYDKYEAMLRAQAARRIGEGEAVRTDAPSRSPLPQAIAINWNLLPAVCALAGVMLVIARFDVIRATVRDTFEAATSVNSSATTGVALTVTSLSCQGSGNEVIATGEVQNRSQRTMRLEANLSIEDRYGGVGATLHARAKLDTSPLASLAISTFTAHFPVRPQYADHCRVSGFVDSDGHDVSFNLATGMAPDSDEHAR